MDDLEQVCIPRSDETVATETLSGEETSQISVPVPSATIRLQHELVNANHSIQLGITLLSRYWAELIAELDEFEATNPEFCLDNDRLDEIRTCAPRVVEGIALSARRIETLLAVNRETAADNDSSAVGGVRNPVGGK